MALVTKLIGNNPLASDELGLVILSRSLSLLCFGPFLRVSHGYWCFLIQRKVLGTFSILPLKLIGLYSYICCCHARDFRIRITWNDRGQTVDRYIDMPSASQECT